MNCQRVQLYSLLLSGFLFPFFLFFGCSTNSPNLLIPGEKTDNLMYQDVLPLTGLVESNTSRIILGQWTADFNISSLAFTIEPDRSSANRYNITSILPPSIRINSYDPASFVLNVDVTLENCYSIDGYDLRLIVFNSSGHDLKNADYWTDSYDIPGGLPINPFKAYAKDDPERIFRSGSQHTENLEIYCPNGSTNIKFAIDVGYPGHSQEPYGIDNFMQETLLKDSGSSAKIWVDVHDWQDDVSIVYLYCPEIAVEPLVEFVKTGMYQYTLDLVNGTGANPGIYTGIIAAFSHGLALYQFVPISVSSARNTIGLLYNSPGAYKGYTLFTPLDYNVVYLIDNNGDLVNSWQNYLNANLSVRLLENGHLLSTIMALPGVNGGTVQEKDWENNVVWEYSFPPDGYRAHHDIEVLPDGNILFIAQETKNKVDSLMAGRKREYLPTGELYPEVIVEIKPTGPSSGEIVWEWHVWDHLASENGGFANGRIVSRDITDPGKFNINYITDLGADWLHFNSINYNPQFDQIMISNRNFNEILIIKHTADYGNPAAGIETARGEAGDILYRWGNPQAYGAGQAEDEVLFSQHDAQWIEPGLPGEGDITVFNNGGNREFSSVDEIIPPVDSEGNYLKEPGSPFGPFSLTWTYTAENPLDFFSAHISSAQRLPNGNTLICSGMSGWLFEVTFEKEIVWGYENPSGSGGPQRQGIIPNNNDVFRCRRYGLDFPGFIGHDLTPHGPIELPPE
jgi:hypothetical protein